MTGEPGESIEVRIPISTAQSGLPTICAMTGQPADGAIPVPVGRSLTRWRSPVVRVPLSKAMFTRWSRRESIHIKTRGVAMVLTAVGVAIAFRNGPLAIAVLGVAVAIHLVDLWAERSAGESRPSVRRDGANVILGGVHERFASAVEEMAN